VLWHSKQSLLEQAKFADERTKLVDVLWASKVCSFLPGGLYIKGIIRQFVDVMSVDLRHKQLVAFGSVTHGFQP
jgi:hypothetical protein